MSEAIDQRSNPPMRVSALLCVHLCPMYTCALSKPAVPMRMDRLGLVVGLGLLSTRHWWPGSSGLGIQQSFHTPTLDDSPDDDQMSTSAARYPRSQSAPSHLRDTPASHTRTRLCRQPQRSGTPVCRLPDCAISPSVVSFDLPRPVAGLGVRNHEAHHRPLKFPALSQGSSGQPGDARGVQTR